MWLRARAQNETTESKNSNYWSLCHRLALVAETGPSVICPAVMSGKPSGCSVVNKLQPSVLSTWDCQSLLITCGAMQVNRGHSNTWKCARITKVHARCPAFYLIGDIPVILSKYLLHLHTDKSLQASGRYWCGIPDQLKLLNSSEKLQR